MIQSRNIDDLLAIGRLYEFSSNRRFHLIKNEFLNDEIGKKALEINQNIKDTKGIDLFQAKSEKDLIEYESHLNQYTTTKSNSIIGPIEIGDEEELMKLQEDFPSNKISQYKITVSRALKTILKKHNLIVPDAINLCKSCDKVSYVKECASFFATKRFKEKGHNKLILFHLTFDGPNDSTQNNRVEYFYFDELNEQGIQNLKIAMMFFLDDDNLDMVNYPIRLFLIALNRFAVVIKIGLESKKFFYNVLLPAHIRQSDISNYWHTLVKTYRNEHIDIIAMTNGSRIQVTAIFLYAISLDRLV